MHSSSLRVRFVLGEYVYVYTCACVCVALVYRARECVTISDILWYACTRVHLCIYRSCNFFPRQDLYRFIDREVFDVIKYFFVNLWHFLFFLFFNLLFVISYFFNSKKCLWYNRFSSFDISGAYICHICHIVEVKFNYCRCYSPLYYFIRFMPGQ